MLNLPTIHNMWISPVRTRVCVTFLELLFAGRYIMAVWLPGSGFVQEVTIK